MAKTSAKNKSPSITGALQDLLKDTYSVFLLTHNYHWNVEGHNFVSLHTLFEQQYTELFAAIDEIAERIRALDAYALPNHYADILTSVGALSSPLLKEKEKNKAAVSERMIANLITLNDRVVASAQVVKLAADAVGDQESEDLAIARIQVHQKSLWMLRSIIK